MMDNVLLLKKVRAVSVKLGQIEAMLLKDDGVISFINEPLKPKPKSDVQLDIEKFMAMKLGQFAFDIVSASDLVATLTNSDFAEHLSAVPGRFTAVRVGLLLRSIGGSFNTMMVGYKGEGNKRAWVIRNYDRYRLLTPGEMFDEYNVQRS